MTATPGKYVGPDTPSIAKTFARLLLRPGPKFQNWLFEATYFLSASDRVERPADNYMHVQFFSSESSRNHVMQGGQMFAKVVILDSNPRRECARYVIKYDFDKQQFITPAARTQQFVKVSEFEETLERMKSAFRKLRGVSPNHVLEVQLGSSSAWLKTRTISVAKQAIIELANRRRKSHAAAKIQRAFRKAQANPYHPIGQRRLLTEFGNLGTNFPNQYETA